MRRRGVAFGLALAAGLAVPVLAGAWDLHPVVRVGDRPLAVRGEVRYGQVYVDVRALAGALGLRVVYFPDRPLRGVWLQDLRRGIFVHLHVGQPDCHVGTETVRTGFPTLYLQRGSNAPLAPVRLVARVFGFQVRERRAGLVREVAVLPAPRGAGP